MSARELTKFIAKHFNPKWAINMDGGGSSSMYIDGHGCAVNNIVNYPCNDGDGVWDQVGQRMLSTFFLVEYDE
jgi:exopolysaccharide biosynthesis protein